MPNQNILKFQKSITKELLATHERVRDLIGNANWGDEGRYKEAILRKIISQFLPSNLKIGSGFIVANNDHINGTESKISKQLDIIIYEDKTPVIFKEGDFVILTENSVRAVIEVKAKVVNTNTKSNGLNKIIEKLELLNDFQTFSNQERKKKFVGVFSYNYDQDFHSQTLEDILKRSSGIVNHLALGCDKFIKYWKDPSELIPRLDRNDPCFIKYKLKDLSFSYFISNLLHIVSDEDPIERYWFSFPIPETKEINREEPIIYLE